jgi:hypoxanthine phosphoribosyltransferase
MATTRPPREPAEPRPEPVASAAQIAAAVERIAHDVATSLAGRRVVAVPVLNGALFFSADLLRALAGRLEIEGYASAVVSSYGDGREAGTLRIGCFPERAALEERTVLVIDTVVDTGGTIEAARREALARGAREVVVACLVDKPARRRSGVASPEWRGLDGPDRFLVGYGLDARGRWRTLPWLGALPAAGR